MLHAFNQSGIHEWHVICFGAGEVLQLRKRCARARRMSPDAKETATGFTRLNNHMHLVKFIGNKAMSLSS